MEINPLYNLGDQVKRKDYPDIYGLIYEIIITENNTLMYVMGYFHEGNHLSVRCYDFELDLVLL